MRRVHRSTVAAACAAAVLAVIGSAYWYTVEPAPAIKVRWRDGLDAGRRAALERRFLLVDPIAAEGRTITYNALDTSADNLAAIVAEVNVEDTSEIDRERYVLPADVPYGTRWTWVGRRLPLLRTPGVIESIVALCCAVIVAAAALSWRRRRTERASPEAGELS